MVFRWMAIVLLAGYTVSANAALEDFETPQIDSCAIWGTAPTGWSIEGETAAVSDLAEATCATLNTDGAYSGTQAIVNYNDRTGTLVIDSGAFDLSSFWIHTDDRDGDNSVRIAGLTSDDQELYSTTVIATTEWTEVVVDWPGIVKFTWDPTTPDSSSNITIDDMTFEPGDPLLPAPTTPVPSATTYGLIMLILGMLLVAGFRFRGSAKLS